jgi:hypothetical protein
MVRLSAVGVLVAILCLLPGYVLADEPKPDDEAVSESGGESTSPGVPRNGLPVEMGNLLITTFPAGAEVRVSSEVFGTTPLEPVSVKAGWHLVQAEKSELFASTRIRVRPGELTSVALTLDDERGILSVVSTPPEASVLVDGRVKGWTPLRLDGISAGDHSLRISKHGYLDYDTAVEIRSAEESVVNVDLPVPAVLDLRSEPEGADVFIGREYLGRTPMLARSVRPGRVDVSMELPNFEEWSESVTVGEGESRLLVAQMEAKTLPLDFFSDPPGASIEMDGETIGTTPLRWAVPLGDRRFVFRLTGHEDYVLRTYVSFDTDPDLKAVLKPLAGFVTLMNAPAGATVTLLDAEPRTWTSPLEGVEVNIGPRRFRIQAPGYRTQEIRAEIGHEEELVLEPQWVSKSGTGGLHRVLIPGWSQRYQEKRTRSIVIPAAQAAALAGLIITTSSYNSAVDEYDTAWNRYLNEVAPEAIDDAWRETQTRHDRVEDKKSLRNVFLAASVGVYVFNIVDALFLGSDFEASPRAGLDMAVTPENEGFSLHVRCRF